MIIINVRNRDTFYFQDSLMNRRFKRTAFIWNGHYSRHHIWSI